MPNAAYSGTTDEIAPCELAEKSTEPVLSEVRIGTSSPSWAAGATCTSMRPPLFCLTSSANFTEPSCLGLPTAALWPSVSFIGACACAAPASAMMALAISAEIGFIVSLL